MPTIRRPSWRARKIHGYDVESFKTHDNRLLEVDDQFRMANLTPEARALFLRMRLDIYFIRRPKGQQIATLIKIDANHQETYDLLNGFDSKNAPLVHITADNKDRPWNSRPRGEGFGVIMYGAYHYSFVSGHVKSYMNGNPEWLWDAVKRAFRWHDASEQDKRAIDAVADAFRAEL